MWWYHVSANHRGKNASPQAVPSIPEFQEKETQCAKMSSTLIGGSKAWSFQVIDWPVEWSKISLLNPVVILGNSLAQWGMGSLNELVRWGISEQLSTP